MTKPREVVPNLEAAVRAGNVADMTASFLAPLLADQDQSQAAVQHDRQPEHGETSEGTVSPGSKSSVPPILHQ
jgi:hypothetical protein